jgi:hypothetical protein
MVVDVTAVIGFFIIALLLIAQRPNNWLVWLASLAYITGGVAHPPTLTVLESVPGFLFPVSLIQTLGFVLTIALHLTFPTGQFVPGWTRIFFVGLVLWAALWPFFPLTPINLGQWSGELKVLVLGICFGLAALAQIHRYRRTNDAIVRQQIKCTRDLLSRFVSPLLRRCASVGPNRRCLFHPALSFVGC